MSTCLDCYGTNTIEPCSDVGCLSTNFGKCIIYSGESLFCAAGPISTFSFLGTAVAAVADTTVVVSSTGGTGTGATFSVTRGPASTSYTVSIVNPGSGYVLADSLTIAGTAVGGTSPANDITVTVVTLAALINNTYTIDAAVKNLHQRICELTPAGLLYSGFSYSCLRVGGNLESVGASISTAQQFVESASAALCALNTRTKAVETPTFTVPSCAGSLTSGTSTLSQILTVYGSILCNFSTGQGIEVSGVTVPSPYTFTTAPLSTDPIGDWFDWTVDNVLSQITTTNGNVTNVTNTVAGLTSFVGSTTKFNNSANCLTSLGGTSADSLHSTVGYLTTKTCSLDTTMTAIPSFIKTNSISLNWVGSYGSSPYNYTNAATTVETQLQRIVNVLNLEKVSFTSDFTVTTAPSGARTVALAASSSFACSALATCSIGGIGDVSITTPAISNILYYNGTNWVNKAAGDLITVESTDSTVVVTKTLTSGNVNYNLSVTGNSSTRAEYTAVAVASANNTVSGQYPALPGSGYLQAIKQGNLVTLNGAIRLVSISNFTITNDTPIPVATAPVGYRPPASVHFPFTIMVKATSPFTAPSNIIHGVAELNSAGTLIFTPYPIFPADAFTIPTGGSIELLLGGMSYSVMP